MTSWPSPPSLWLCYRTGIELANTAKHAVARSRALAAITGAIEVLEHTEATAVHHARLIAHARRSGKALRARDLIVAFSSSLISMPLVIAAPAVIDEWVGSSC